MDLWFFLFVICNILIKLKSLIKIVNIRIKFILVYIHLLFYKFQNFILLLFLMHHDDQIIALH